MGLFADILEANRERGNFGYVDPCMVMGSVMGKHYCKFEDYRNELNRYKQSDIDIETQKQIKEEFIKKSAELERIKAGYLVAKKNLYEIKKREKIQSAYMNDILETLLSQLRNAYLAICQLRSEIDSKLGFNKVPDFTPESEEIIRTDLLDKLIRTTLYHMDEGIFTDTSTFRKVVSDCAEIIRCLKKEEYLNTDKSVFSYYLMETVGLKPSQHQCRNCGTSLLNNTAYCLNCYERNV